MSSGLISTEFLLLRVCTMQQRLAVGVFYRPPSTDTQYFIDFQDTLEHLHPCDFQNLLICGDFNINVSDSSSPTLFHPLLEQLCLQFSLSQIATGHSSILDLVLLSNPHSCTITEPIATSEHLSVLVQLSSSNRSLKVKPTRRKVWMYKAANTEVASHLFSSFDASLFKHSCVNESWSVWKSKFWSVVHATIPSKTVPIRGNLDCGKSPFLLGRSCTQPYSWQCDISGGGKDCASFLISGKENCVYELPGKFPWTARDCRVTS